MLSAARLVIGVLVLVLLVAADATGVRAADRRVALVVGNSQYRNAPALLNPVNDADDISATLKSIGFDVIEVRNADKSGMDTALAQFARASTAADVSLFFYAGHGLQFQGRNYLLPVDAELEDEVSLRYQTVSIDDVRAALDRAKGVKVMVLDACRNNPLVERLTRSVTASTRDISSTRGLARMAQTKGMVIAYSTQADQVAQDGASRNSPFSRALANRLKEPGLEISTLFRRVTRDVDDETHGQQIPELSISLTDDVYLNRSETDTTAWQRIRDLDDPKQYADFMARYPDSVHYQDAKYRLEVLNRVLDEQKRIEQARSEAEANRREAEALRAQAEELRVEAEARANATEAELRAHSEAEKRAIEAEQQRLAAVCRDESAHWDQMKAKGDSQAVREMLRQTTCPTVIAAINEYLKEEPSSEANCRRDQAQLDAAGPADSVGLRSVLQRASCASVRAAAASRLDEIEARRNAQDGACRTDLDAFVRAKASPTAAKDLASLAAVAKCPQVAALAGAEIKALEAQARAEPSAPAGAATSDTPARMQAASLENEAPERPATSVAPAPSDRPEPSRQDVSAAQAELRRLGCYAGPEDGTRSAQLDAAVTKARRLRKEAAGLGIDAAFITALRQTRHPLCGVLVERKARSPHPAKAAAARPAGEPKAVVATPVASNPVVPNVAAEPRPHRAPLQMGW